MNDVFDFEGYELSKAYFDLTKEEIHVLSACYWMVDNRATIRETAENCEYSSTTFWRRIHNECKQLSPELYKLVVKQMHANLLFPKRKKKVKNVIYVRTKI